MIAAEGQAFYDPAADQALFAALRAGLAGNVELVELDLEINDPRFAQAMAERMHAMLAERPTTDERS
jgi:uncharacterized protein (UPF0261 family)